MAEKSLKISIVTVCLNDEKNIGAALESIFTQTYPHLEIIIIDGGSTDGTLNIIHQYRERIAKIVSEKDQGIYDAMNKGIRLATGDIVYFLNADDRFVDDQVVSDIVQEFLRYPSVAVLYGKVQSYNPPGGYPINPRTYLSPVRNKVDILIHGIGHQRIFAKREIFDKTGPFDDRFRVYADLDWMLKAYRPGRRFQFMDRFFARYNTQGASFIKRYSAIPEKIQVSYKNSEWWEFIIYFTYVSLRKVIDLVREYWYALTQRGPH